MVTSSRLREPRRFAAHAAVLAAAAVSAVTVGWSYANAVHRPAAGWIAFHASSHRAGGHGLGIYVMRADGSSLRRLTRGSHDDFPAWSPDGRKLAFVRSVITGGKATSDVFVVNVDGSGLRRLVPGAEFMDWSPDGRRLAFVRIVGDVETVFVANAGGGAAQSVTTVPDFAGLAWSPNGTRIAYAGSELDAQGNPGPNFLGLMNPDGTSKIKLVVSADSPAWSPDGSRIAFVHSYTGLGGTGDTWVIAAVGGAPKRVTRTGEHPSWSPDGRKLVVGGVRQLAGGIGPSVQYDTLFVINADGTKRTLLDPFGPRAKIDASNPAWHR
jgi:Tol biopolymer transport system component